MNEVDELILWEAQAGRVGRTWHSHNDAQIDGFWLLSTFERLVDQIARSNRTPFVVEQRCVRGARPVLPVTFGTPELGEDIFAPGDCLRIAEADWWGT